MTVLSNIAAMKAAIKRHERAAQAALAANLEMHECDVPHGKASFSCNVNEDLYVVWHVDFSTNLEEGSEGFEEQSYTFWYRSLDTIDDYAKPAIKVDIIGPDDKSTVMLSPKFLHPDAVFLLIEEATMAHEEED